MEFLKLFWPPEVWAQWYVAFVAVVGVVALGFLGLKGHRLRHTLALQIALLRGIKERELTESASAREAFKRIKDSFQKGRLLRTHWSEFEATLIKKEPVRYLTTQDSGAFFNEFTLVDSPLWMELLKHVPGILTALGIVGTFLGLILGLQDFSDANIQSSVSRLLLGVHNAFTCSFWAVALSVLVTFVERWTIADLYGRVHLLQENLNRLFNRSLSENYLEDMVHHMDQQTQSLKSLSQDLSQAITQAMEELVARQSQSIAQANQLVADRISEAMGQSLGPAIDKLTTAVGDVQRQQSQGAQQALESLVDRFSRTMVETTGQQMNGLMAGMQTTTETLVSLKTEMGQFVHLVQLQMSQQQDHLQAAMEAMARQTGDQQLRMQAMMERFVTDTVATMDRLQGQLAEQSGDSVRRVGDELTRLISEANSRQNAAIHELGEATARMHAQLDERMREMLRHLGEVSATQTNQLTGAVQATVSQLQAQSDGMSKNQQALTLQVAERIDQLGQIVVQLMERSQATSSDLTDKVANGAERLAGLIGHVEGMLGSFEAVTDQNRELAREMGKNVGQYREAASLVANASSDYRAVHQAAAQMMASYLGQAQIVEARIVEFQRVVDQLRNLTDGLQTTCVRHGEALGHLRGDTDAFFTQVREGVQAFRASVHESMERYHMVSSDSMGRFLGQVETQLGTAVTMLGSTIQELGDALAEVPARR